MGFVPRKWVPKEVRKYVPKEILTPKEPDIPAVPEVPEVVQDVLDPGTVASTQAQAGEIQKKIERRKRGKQSTILTGGLGVTEAAETRRPTILGIP